MKVALETHSWRATDQLKTVDDMIAYLEAAFEDGTPELVATCIEDVARAKGVEVPAALRGESSIGDLIKVMKALGFELSAKAA